MSVVKDQVDALKIQALSHKHPCCQVTAYISFEYGRILTDWWDVAEDVSDPRWHPPLTCHVTKRKGDRHMVHVHLTEPHAGLRKGSQCGHSGGFFYPDPLVMCILMSHNPHICKRGWFSKMASCILLSHTYHICKRVWFSNMTRSILLNHTPW